MGERRTIEGAGATGKGPEPLDRTRHTPDLLAKRLLDGGGWKAYCRDLEEAGTHLLAAGRDQSPGTRAEGFEYLLGLVTAGVRQALELGDPDRPRFLRNPDSMSRWGAENADNQYLWTRIRSDARYRIVGERGSAFTFLVEVKAGYMQLGDDGNFATLTADEIQCEPDGSFEILLSAEDAGASGARNWLPLHPEARYVAIRQFFVDWENELPARFQIECVEPSDPDPAGVESIAGVVDSAGEWVLRSARFWSEWTEQLRARGEHAGGRGSLAPAMRFVGGADAIYYGNDLYRVGEGEALLVEVEPPQARYWSFQLCDLWFRSMDYANRQTSLNHGQAYVDGDGRVRIVVAHRDPGVANWLDTGGQDEGMIQYRWVWTESNPLPSARLISFAELDRALPPDTRRVGAAARRRAIASRRRHVALREPAT